MNTTADEQNADPTRRPQGGRSGNVRLVARPRAGQPLWAAGMIGGLLPGMVLGLVVGLLTDSFLLAAAVGLVAVVIGGFVGARLGRRSRVDAENPAVS